MFGLQYLYFSLSCYFLFYLFIWMAASLWCWVRDRSPRLLKEYQWFNSWTACLSLFFFFHFWVSIVYFLVYFGFSIFLLILIELLLTDIKKINNKEKKNLTTFINSTSYHCLCINRSFKIKTNKVVLKIDYAIRR